MDDEDREERSGAAEIAAVEGGCCLLELFGAAAFGCLALLVLPPLLIG